MTGEVGEKGKRFNRSEKGDCLDMWYIPSYVPALGGRGYILHLKLSSKSLPETRLPMALLRLLGAGETVITGEATGALKSESLPVVSRLNSQIDSSVLSFGSKSETPFPRNAHLSSPTTSTHTGCSHPCLSSLNQCEQLRGGGSANSTHGSVLS